MESPLVSVCIPAYNNADTILETIQSVLSTDLSESRIDRCG